MRSVRAKYNQLKKDQAFTRACKYVQSYVNNYVRQAMTDSKAMKQADIALLIEKRLGRLEEGGLIVRIPPEKHVIKFTAKMV